MKISTAAAHWEISRENRDRPGGHVLSDVKGVDWYASSPEGRKFGKRKLNKKRRRQHDRITSEAVNHHIYDTHYAWAEAMMPEYYDDMYGLDEEHDALIEMGMGDLEYVSHYDCDDFDDLSWYDDYLDCPYDEYMTPDYSSSKTIGELKITVDSQMIVQALPIAAARPITVEDAGRTLGEILEEALQRARA